MMIGILNDVTPDGIVVDGKSIPFFEEDDMMKRGSGVPVGVGYITTGSGISSILCQRFLYGKKVLYKSANPFTD